MMKRFIYLLIFLLSFYGGSSYAGDHPVNIKMELTSTMINRVLHKMFTETSLHEVKTGSLPELGVSNYSIALSQPVIGLEQNSIRLSMRFDCSGVALGIPFSYSFSVLPNLIVNPEVYSSSKLTATLQDFPAQLQTISYLPNWLESLIISYYNTQEFWLYPSKLIQEANNSSEWLKQRGVKLKPASQNGLSIAYQIKPNLLEITFTTLLNARNPVLWAAVATINGKVIFGIQSTIRVHIVNVFLTTLSGSTLFNGAVDVWCEKDQDVSFKLYDGSISIDPKVGYVLFRTDDTFYWREYNNLIGVVWSLPIEHPIINN